MVRTVTVGLVLTTLSGCSLVNPFVARDRMPRPLPPAKTTSLSQALEYGEAVKDAYRGALRDQSQLLTWLGIGLIPLTAAAMGLGARAAAPDAVLGLGLGGASAYGIGTWLHHKPRQLAWAAGLKAVTCVQTVAAPLRAANEEDLAKGLKDLQVALRTLSIAAGALETQADLAKAAMAGASSSQQPVVDARTALASLEEAARAELKDARAVTTAAEKALRSGEALQHTLASAGEMVAAAIARITDQVDAIVVETQRDPEALAAVISGLGSMYGKLTTVPEALATRDAKAALPPPTTPQGLRLSDDAKAARESLTNEEKQQRELLRKEEKALGDALRQFRTDLAELDGRRLAVSALVNPIVKESPLPKLKDCGVQRESVITALSAEPPSPLKLVKPGSVVFSVKGGVPPYEVTVASGVSGLVVTQSRGTVTVAATKDTPAGQYGVSVVDATNKPLEPHVTVAVEDKAPSRATAEPSDAVKQLAERLSKATQPVTVDGVTVKIIGAEVDKGGKVVATLEVTAVTVDAKTEGAYAAVKKKLLDEHGKGLDVPEGMLVLAPDDVLSKVTLDKKKPAKPTPPTMPSTSCPDVQVTGVVKPDPEFEKLSPEKKKQLQRGLCLKDEAVDGLWGRITKGMVVRYQCATGAEKRDGILTAGQVKELLNVDPATITSRCSAN